MEDNGNNDKEQTGLTQDDKRMKKGTREINVNETEIVVEEERGLVEEGEKINGTKNEEVEGDVQRGERSKGEERDEDEREGKEIEEHAPPKDQYNSNRPTNITYTDMAETGKKVKRILDHGRVKFLKCIGLRAAQIKYCHPSLSPECIMIVADRQK